MKLESNLKKELWDTIKTNYENESYSNSILDSIYLLTETIRNKTGLEGDGASLVGEAFGGNKPKIKLNKLQTESEKNIQRGMQELLRGIYTTIRNPRSHDKLNDSKKDADAIIVFINYLLGLIDISKSSFDESDFLERVFDEYFVEDNNYANLLISEIPNRQRINIAIEIVLNRDKGDIPKMRYFTDALFKKLKDNEIDQVYEVMSEEFKYISSHEDIRIILGGFPSKYWNRLDKAVKWRIEKILEKNVREGRYDYNNDTCYEGDLGTWIEVDHLRCFEEYKHWNYLIINKLKSEQITQISYVDKFFWNKICKLNYDKLNFHLKQYIKDGLLNKDDKIIDDLVDVIMLDKDHPWWKAFENELIGHEKLKRSNILEIPF